MWHSGEWGEYVIIIGAAMSLCTGIWVSDAAAVSDQDFEEIGRRYGVSPHLLKAISLIESRGGEITGKHEVSKVVGDTQLKFLQKIAWYTGRPLSDFKGSPAGAMGYMQIIPSTFYYYAQDGDHDGMKDPLNNHDSLATAAYFLARSVALTQTLCGALRRYNNSARYCNTVIALYEQLKANAVVAETRPDFQTRTP